VRQRSCQDKQASRVIKDTSCNILTGEEDIKHRWKTYFEELSNVENKCQPFEHAEPVRNQKRIFQEKKWRMQSRNSPAQYIITILMLLSKAANISIKKENQNMRAEDSRLSNRGKYESSARTFWFLFQ